MYILLLFALALALANDKVATARHDQIDKLPPLQIVSSSNEQFSGELFKKLWKANREGKNLVSSPLSVHILLTLIHQGSDGEPAKLIARSLRLPQDSEIIRQGVKFILDKLNDLKGVTFQWLNRIYISNKYTLNEDFMYVAGDSYKCDAFGVEFGKVKSTIEAINDWVDLKTRHKIQKIVGQNDISSDTSLILLNAIYFKGEWHKGFERAFTRKRLFHLNEINHKMVDTMFISERFFHGQLPELDAQFIELPYKSKELKMIIVLPNEINGLGRIVHNLQYMNQTRLAANKFKRKIELSMPKFKIKSNFDFKNILREFGIRNIFLTATYKHISEELLKINKIIQKAVIEVNEGGSETEAITGGSSITRIYRDSPMVFNVDKPFLYQIVDVQTSAVLLIGSVSNP